MALVSDQGSGFWLMKSLPANIPYINLLFLNTGQAIIAMFLSSEFLKSDKKLDTSEVFYVHPLSNAEYVIGKIWGNAVVFIRLDILIIVLVVAFNIMSGVYIDWFAYLIYFTIICIPTLIYIFGLSVGLMLILKNQALTFVILLGYIALTLFYIGDKFYYLFDYMAYNLPLVKSSIVGFSNWTTVINHRLIYLLLGIGFICLSIFLFRRLPNTNMGKYRWLIASIVFLLAGIWTSYFHVNSILKAEKLRKIYTEVNNQYVSSPKMVIDSYDINLNQQPNSIYSEVEMQAVALEESDIFTFCLNPGLKVIEVTENNISLEFSRYHQILLIDFGRRIDSGNQVKFKVKYTGTINENFCYLDIPSEILQAEYASNLFKIDKKYSFQNENYLLFTPETYWYPRPGTSYSNENPDWQQAYFSHFRLKVTTINNLKALSQGIMKWPIVNKVVVDSNGVKQTNILPESVSQINLENDTLRSRQRGPRRNQSLTDGQLVGESRPRGGQPTAAVQQRGESRPRGSQPPSDIQPRGEVRPRNVQPPAEGQPRGQRPMGQDMERRRNRDSLNLNAEQPQDSSLIGKKLNDTNLRVVTEVVYDSVFIYETDFLTPSISLIIGDYEQKSVEVDETLYSIWHLKGHDYFAPVFEPITDTIPAQIRERRRSIETAYSLDYSFSRFSLIEVPVQFYSYARTWTQAQEVMQPEMVLFPEKGSLVNTANVVEGVRNTKRWAQQNGQEISDEEAALRVLNQFLWQFERAEADFDWSQDRGSVNVAVKPNPFFLFPQLYNFRYNVFSSEWPVSNRLIELFLQNKTDNNNWIRQMNGISNNEKANLLMQQAPFKELLTDVKHKDLMDNVTSLKANTLFAYAEESIGYREIKDSLRKVLQRNVFTNLRFESLLDTMGMIANVDLHKPLEAWYHPTALPVFILGTPEVTQITNRDGEVYIVKLQITNDSDSDGVLDVEINFGGGQGNDIYDPRTKRIVPLKARETKILVSVWDEVPRNIIINTLISANLPATINLPLNNIVRERNKPIDEEGDFIIENVSYSIPGEIIVDNEDSTLFKLSEPEVVGLLPQWLDQVDDNSFRYSGVSNWRPPLRWTLTTNDKYYGTHIRSAYVIKSGSGNQTATWRIPVPNSGQYELYFWVTKPDELRRGRGGRGGDTGETEYHFKVKYDGDEENAFINLQSSEEGWSILGTYFFSNDTVEVVLRDDSKLRSITADAVKIVRK